MTQVSLTTISTRASTAQEAQQPVLSEQQMRIWRKLVQANAQLLGQLEANLMADHGLALAEYDVLARLADAPHQRLRMTELAQKVLLSRSGLTRLVDRMTMAGLIERQACVSDARGLYAVLTPAGYHRMHTASASHYRGIHTYLLGQMSPQQHDCLEGILDLIVGPDDGDQAR